MQSPDKKTAAGKRTPAVPIQRRLTLDLERAEGLAAMLANSRASEIIEVSDLLAGMYINDWERLSRYWGDLDEIEAFMHQFCKLSPPRWQYWLQYYDEMRNASRRSQSLFARFFKRNGKTPPAKIHQRSEELDRILAFAAEISPFRDKANGRDVPILTTESVLVAIAKNEDLEISKKLRETGIDVNGLERAARFPKHAPLH